ncbi:MAG: 3-isopropylmalate dehydratase small subunit [Oscillatoriophycideae cyanobacterium NC_groundwater_1537_Pr4_S-0.65um_50_18]|nr:3-isopropylmalate dehydratase small subunit [Oscillatoriophycideae cyanobacterium NC_groundwater_1537_Pr4_S-0.65um_50_18]
MSQVKSIAGRGIPLVGNDVDTDRIIPARFLRCVTFDGLGEQVFTDDRAQAQRTSEPHAFDQPQYQGATLMVVNRNFGCGSSREHAPQAIAKWGIKALIGESFAEIFFGNCVAMGIPCVTAAPEDVQRLQDWLAEFPQNPIKLDLEALEVRFGHTSVPVLMGEGARNMFLSGTWDACGQLVAQAEQVRQTAARLPYVAWS